MNLEKTQPKTLQKMLEHRIKQVEEILREAKNRGYLVRRESVCSYYDPTTGDEKTRHETTVVYPRDAFLPITRFFIYERCSNDPAYSTILSEGHSQPNQEHQQRGEGLPQIVGDSQD